MKSSKIMGIVAVASLGIGLLVGSLQSGCGAVESTACAADECPAGPQGPVGPQGPEGNPGETGPPGPGFGTCKWHYTGCTPGAGVECQAICPTGTNPASGGCDVSAGGTLVESMPANGQPTIPDSPNTFTGFDRWNCESSSGNVQSAYALCCAP